MNMNYKEALRSLEDHSTILKKQSGRDEDHFKHYLREVVDCAIAAVEKQIPKKPKITIYNGYCPHCGEAFGRRNIETAALTGFKYFRFCPVCGQALNWEEVAEV